MPFTLLTSIHGRKLGLSTTGGLIIGTSRGSTIFDNIAVVRDSTGALISPHDESVVTTTSTGGATLTFGGVVVLNSSAVAPSFTITAPRPGQGMEIYNISTVSTTLSFGGTSTSQVFQKIGGVSAGATIITFDNAAPSGNSFILRGLSATKFGFLPGSTAAWT